MDNLLHIITAICLIALTGIALLSIAVIAAALHEMEQSEREFEKGDSDAEV